MSGTAKIISTKVLHVTFDGTPTIHEILLRSGTNFSAPCGGNHICGKCKILCTGILSRMELEEEAFLYQSEIADGIRLACFAKALGNVQIYLPKEDITTLSTVVLLEHALTGKGWGAAIDIGTTTIAMQLYRLEDGKLCGEALCANRQAHFGADVISRIDFSNRNGSEVLEKTLRQQLEEMLADCMGQAGANKLDAAVITGNTVMLHFWEGLDAGGIAVAPFTPVSLFDCYSQRTLCRTFGYLPLCIGPYIGADITCAILASGMMLHPEETALLVDLGTNGEIVLRHNGRFSCASTAMGPAFEGANLECGMQAVPGAICAIEQTENEGISFQVISDCAPSGICGSGILDAIRVMLDKNLLDESGLLCESETGIIMWHGQAAWKIPGTEIYVTQKDVRQIQLAKSAVCAGIETLLDQAGLVPEQVEHLYIAGGFGHYMNLTSAARIGLFPQKLKSRTSVIGNAALSGAVLLLLDSHMYEQQRNIRACAEEIPLSGNQLFSERYIENIMFEDERLL